MTGRWEPRPFVSRTEKVTIVIEPHGVVQPYEYKEGPYLLQKDVYGIIVTPVEPEKK